MTIPTLALAVSLACGPALAKDLPWRLSAPKGTVARPTGCEWAGPGYSKMAGTDTCVRVSGSVRVEAGTSSTPAPFVPPLRQ